MARRTHRPDESSTGQGWMVTFSDCMTLLLTFFVLLLTFSSFSDVDRSQFAGACRSFSHNSIFANTREIKDSTVPPIERPADPTESGSEKPTEAEPVNVKRPKEVDDVLTGEAHKDQKVLYLPSAMMFWGDGSTLSEAGREKLKTVAAFMRQLPCHAIIAESRLAEESEPAAASEISQERALAVIENLTQEQGISADWFTIASTGPWAARRLGGQPALQITLLAKGLYR